MQKRKIYPNKKSKAQASLAAKQRLLKVSYEEMIRAIDRYKTELKKDSDWRKPQNGSTFFNSGYLDKYYALKEEGVCEKCYEKRMESIRKKKID